MKAEKQQQLPESQPNSQRSKQIGPRATLFNVYHHNQSSNRV